MPHGHDSPIQYLLSEIGRVMRLWLLKSFSSSGLISLENLVDEYSDGYFQIFKAAVECNSCRHDMPWTRVRDHVSGKRQCRSHVVVLHMPCALFPPL